MIILSHEWNYRCDQTFLQQCQLTKWFCNAGISRWVDNSKVIDLGIKWSCHCLKLKLESGEYTGMKFKYLVFMSRSVKEVWELHRN